MIKKSGNFKGKIFPKIFELRTIVSSSLCEDPNQQKLISIDLINSLKSQVSHSHSQSSQSTFRAPDAEIIAISRQNTKYSIVRNLIENGKQNISTFSFRFDY